MPASVEELDALKAERDAAEEAHKELERELEALRVRLAAIKAENEAVPEAHDWNEDKTRRLLIDLALQRAGWWLGGPHDREYKVTGMPNAQGVGYADYVLWGDDGKPLAVVEAKKATVDPEVGQQQAKLYADCLEAMHGQRPVIFYTNGYQTRGRRRRGLRGTPPAGRGNRHAAGGEELDPRGEGPARIPGLHAGA